MRHLSRFSVLAVAALLAGCGGGGDASETSDTPVLEQAEPAAEVAAAPEASTESSSAPLTVEDIDRWQRGMEAELRAVREAGESLTRATTGEDTVSAMMAANDMSTLGAGARGAGVGEERYRFIRSTLSSAAGHLVPLSETMDVSQMPEPMIQQFEQSRQANLERMSAVLPPEVQEALRARASELRRQDVELTGARLRAAGAIR